MDPEQPRLAKIRQVWRPCTLSQFRTQRRKFRLHGVNPDERRRCRATRHSSAVRALRVQWKSPEMENTFAATTPLESLKYVLSDPNVQGGPITSVTKRMEICRAGRITCTLPSKVKMRAVYMTTSQHTLEEVLRTLYGNRDVANAWDEIFNNAEVNKALKLHSHHRAGTTILWCSTAEETGLTNCREGWNV